MHPELGFGASAVPAVPPLPLHPVARLSALWGSWFVLPLLPSLYALALIVLHGDLRPEHIGFAIVALALGLVGRRTAALYRDLLPFVATSFGYDCVRYARALWVGPERVLGCGLREADMRVVAVTGTSLPEWLGSHHSAAADLMAAVPYAAFIYVALGYAVWLWFRDRTRMRVFLWGFALANAISFVTWIALPAAPPWYVQTHGCAIDMSVLPSAAGLERVDQLLGVSYFGRFYSRAASVFGALPSMHCAYPVLGLLTAWKSSGPRLRAAHVGYALWMASSAVYLEHHWVIDVVAGWGTASVGIWLAGRLLGREPARVVSALEAA